MLVGLPAAGKTYWAIEYCKKNPEKCYNILGVSTLSEKMKVFRTKYQTFKILTLIFHSYICLKSYSKKRQTNANTSTNNSNTSVKITSDLFEKAAKCMNKLIENASQLNRNVILDQVCTIYILHQLYCFFLFKFFFYYFFLSTTCMHLQGVVKWNFLKNLNAKQLL